MKKNLGVLAAAAAAIAGGLVSSPSGQEVAKTVLDNSTKVEAESPQQYINRTQQQAMRALGRTIQNAAAQVYALGGGASNANLRGYGICPKEYGLWLNQSGKNKYNNRRNKHYKKMRSW